MKPVALVSLLIFCGVALAGCGQKGPLYLPGHNPHPPQPMMSPTSSPQPTDPQGDTPNSDQSAQGDHGNGLPNAPNSQSGS
ncbi:MAG: lipoprotein [Salinisphaera sp.]|jgi:predicted small lipoprotein YifL|nr:lipoprotein [Salinisphaera sp.]